MGKLYQSAVWAVLSVQTYLYPVAYLVWTIHSPVASASAFKMIPCRFSAAFTLLYGCHIPLPAARTGIFRPGVSWLHC